MTETPRRIGVVGASGFVGTATVRALRALGHHVVPIKAPRLPPMTGEEVHTYIRTSSAARSHLENELEGLDAVVNTAGIPAATSGNTSLLVSANAALPGLIASVVKKLDANARLVHVSSAAVQGRRATLDESDDYDDFSAYSASKRLGEQFVHQYSDGTAVSYRPPGVHGEGRGVTRLTAKIASSPIGSVASPGDAPSPQALVENVGSAIAFLATYEIQPPRIVIHPWEGLTTSDVMVLLGDRVPTKIPRPLARSLIYSGSLAGRWLPWVAGNVRRLEMMWFGQRQGTSWLTHAGWEPPYGRDAWAALGTAARTLGNTKDTEGKRNA